MSDMLERIRQAFIQEMQDDDWHVTDVQPCTNEQDCELGHYYEALGTYVVEMTAMRDVDGLNKHGAYNKAPKDTKLLYTVWHFSSGRVQLARMQVSPVPKSHPLEVNPSKWSSSIGWAEIMCEGQG